MISFWKSVKHTVIWIYSCISICHYTMYWN